jgi:hypothetical protein
LVPFRLAGSDDAPGFHRTLPKSEIKGKPYGDNGKHGKVTVLVNGSNTLHTVREERYAWQWPSGALATEQILGKSVISGETLDSAAMSFIILDR